MVKRKHRKIFEKKLENFTKNIDIMYVQCYNIIVARIKLQNKKRYSGTAIPKYQKEFNKI